MYELLISLHSKSTTKILNALLFDKLINYLHYHNSVACILIMIRRKKRTVG